MEKAIEIKRRAQRCIQNGDLDGALSEYEKLVTSDDADPYNFVLLADLLFKKGDQEFAAKNYLLAVISYEKSSLFKNAIAVCKKMVRLGLSPAETLQWLARLHAADGLATEASLYFQQYGDLLLRENKPTEAAAALRKAFELTPDSIRSLEQMAEALHRAKDDAGAGRALAEAAIHYQRSGQLVDADRCRSRAEEMQPGVVAQVESSHPVVPVTGHIDGTADAPRVAQPEGLVTPEAVSASLSPPRFTDINDLSDKLGAPLRPIGGGDTEEVKPPRLELDGDARAALRAAMPTDHVSSPLAPGLRFSTPAEVDATPPSRIMPTLETGLALEPAPATNLMKEVESLLARAQESLRSGDREAASVTLAKAARAYDDLGQFESAATIYRSLSKSAHATSEVMEMWLANCEKRADQREAAQVACELGDRALNDGHTNVALRWFEHALVLDESNETAIRRLQRLHDGSGGVATAIPPPPEPAPLPTPPAPPPPAIGEIGRVEIAVGRGQAVTFDLGSVLSEFQRGVETQLKGDPQGHYDLAMTYREMGLLEQAVDSFRIAGQDAEFRHRAAEMTGRCLLDQGRFEDAAQEFATALDSVALDSETSANLRYQLGLALEAAGQPQEALAVFERVYAAQANYPDVALKIRVLRKMLAA